MKPIIKVAMTALLTLLISLNAYSQSVRLTGKVVDAANLPIIGAGVVVQGTTNGTVTGVDGSFSLNAPKGATINVSCIGYNDLNFVVGDENNLTITLAEATELIEETVVIGYGVQRKSDVTGSITSVKAEDLDNRSATDAIQAIQGKAAGVQIINSTGMPGASSTIQIRGYSSNSATTPLMIVDGLKVSSIDYLDPSDIASMEILKDAASAAIYGIEAGNGVILITTKAGAAERGTGRITYSYQNTTQSIARWPDLMNSNEYLEYQELLGAYKKEQFEWDGKTDTDWTKMMTEKGHMSRHTIGFQGRSDKGSLYVSISNMDNNGIIAGDKDIFKRLTGQINAEYKIKSWATVGVTTSLEKRSSRSVSDRSGTNISTIGSILTYAPITPWTYAEGEIPSRVQGAIDQGLPVPRDPDGNVYGIPKFGGNSQIFHPAVMRDKTDSESNGFNVRGTAYLNLTPIKGLTFTSRLGYRAGYNNSHNYNYELYMDSVANTNFSINARSSNNLYYQWENFANYLFNVGKNNFTVMAGMSFQKTTSDNVYGSAEQLTDYSENFRYLDNAVNTSGMRVSGAPSESTNMSYYGRASWGYGNRYNLQASFRADAYDSSKLDKDHRWGYFPSVSAGWTLSNESFLKPILQKAKFSFLKLRASWGINGNVNALGSYQYASTLGKSTSNGYNLGNGFVTGVMPDSVLPNPTIKWETSHQTDIGLDARLFNNRLTIGLDWYNKNTKDLLTSTAAPANTGGTSMYVNAGKINNRGFEIELDWKDTIGDFAYGVSGNAAFLKNKVVEGTSAERVLGSRIWTSHYITYFEEGYPLWYLGTYMLDGIDPQTGEGIYRDVNNDGTINADDQIYAGKGIPDLTYGLTINLAYKNFDFVIYGAGAQGVERLFALYRADAPEQNKPKWYLENSWKSPSSTGYTLPKPNSTDTFLGASNAMVFDASFFKIKQMQLGYSLPRTLLNKVGLSSLRVYVSLDDWFTFTKYPGLDPETNGAGQSLAVDNGAYPISKKAVFGVNLAF